MVWWPCGVDAVAPSAAPARPALRLARRQRKALGVVLAGGPAVAAGLAVR